VRRKEELRKKRKKEIEEYRQELPSFSTSKSLHLSPAQQSSFLFFLFLFNSR
jgi:hypothetical protein